MDSERTEVEIATGDLDGRPRNLDARIREIADIAAAADASAEMADEARRAAEVAKERSAGLGQKRAAIETLQESGVAAAGALAALADSQKLLFDNQKALADSLTALTRYALTSVANTRTVYQRLQLELSGATQGELSELARRELRRVMYEFKSHLDVAQRQEDLDRKLVHLRDVVSETRQEHDEFRQTGLLTQDNADRLDAVVDDLEHQRQVDRAFNESIQDALGRLGEVELLSETTASGLATETARGEQRDESIAQLYGLVGRVDDDGRTATAAIADLDSSTTELVARLRRQVTFALCAGGLGAALGALALLIVLLT